MNYPTDDKELLAIVDAFQEWRPYLSGTIYEVQVSSTIKNLQYFTTTKALNGRQTRWAEFLSQFNFRIDPFFLFSSSGSWNGPIRVRASGINQSGVAILSTRLPKTGRPAPRLNHGAGQRRRLLGPTKGQGCQSQRNQRLRLRCRKTLRRDQPLGRLFGQTFPRPIRQEVPREVAC